MTCQMGTYLWIKERRWSTVVENPWHATPDTRKHWPLKWSCYFLLRTNLGLHLRGGRDGGAKYGDISFHSTREIIIDQSGIYNGPLPKPSYFLSMRPVVFISLFAPKTPLAAHNGALEKCRAWPWSGGRPFWSILHSNENHVGTQDPTSEMMRVTRK